MNFEAVAKQVGYNVYTTEFDRVRNFGKEFGSELLSYLRDQVESYVRQEFDRTSTPDDAPALDEATRELEKAVASVIAETGVSPTDTVIAFLMDNSGSVRGLGSVFARAMTRVCRVLDKFGFDTPVVGHTTSLWKGGQSMKKWAANGRPQAPGRLNDILFTVYKEPGQHTNEDDARLYGLANGREYRENIDGEALAWIAGKVEALDYKNKSIVFMSDGNSVDDATLSVNKADFLRNHRNAVIEEIDESDIALVQVRVGRPHRDPLEAEIPTFGDGEIGHSSEVVRVIAQAVVHAIRMQATPKAEMIAPTP